VLNCGCRFNPHTGEHSKMKTEGCCVHCSASLFWGERHADNCPTLGEKVPQVGTLATLCYPQDRYPLVVTRVGKNWVEVSRIETNGLPKTGECNGFPVFDYQWVGNIEEHPDLKERVTGLGVTAFTCKAYLRKDGFYYRGGTRIRIGSARYYRNYSD
jgi:hypothetical protein